MKLPLSVFIIAHNEADRIGATINSVKDFADEIIVIDSGSTDDTMSVATFLGATAIHNPWPGYGLQKRFGEDQCRNRWLLNLDADEEITPALADEIRQLFLPSPLAGLSANERSGRDGGAESSAQNAATPHPNLPHKIQILGGKGFREPPLAGYVIQINDMLPGEKTLLPVAHTNYCLRLYNRDKGRFSDSPVHDSVILEEGETAMLRQPALHRSFRSLSHAIDKMNDYSSAQAENLRKRGLKFPHLRLLIEFPMAFFKVYIIRGYCLRGWRGFIYAVNYAFGRFVRIAKYLE